jgi:TRAP-type C4-dicarboxylate transport system permease small subunit
LTRNQEGAVTWLERFFNGLRGANKAVLIALYAVIIAICFVAVVFRYVLNDSLTWAEELSRYLFIAMVFLGAAYVVPENGHLRMDVLYLSLPHRFRRIIDIITMLCAVFFLVYAVKALWIGVVLVGRQRWSSLPLPMRWAYLPMLIGAILSLVYLVEIVWRGARGPRPGAGEPVQRLSDEVKLS